MKINTWMNENKTSKNKNKKKNQEINQETAKFSVLHELLFLFLLVPSSNPNCYDWIGFL